VNVYPPSRTKVNVEQAFSSYRVGGNPEAMTIENLPRIFPGTITKEIGASC
jgi:hypothetical protein